MKKGFLFLPVVVTIAGLILFSNAIKRKDECQTSQDDNIEYGVEWNWVITSNEYKDFVLVDNYFIGVKNQEDKYGFINRDGQVVVECNYSNIVDVNDGVALVLDFDNKFLFADLQKNTVFNDTYEDAIGFREGYAAVKVNDEWGFINRNDELIIDFQYDEVLVGFSDGYAGVKKDGNWFFIDQNGEMIFDSCFDNIKRFNDGYAGVMIEDRWGVIDKEGIITVVPQYLDVGVFSEGLVAVKSIVDAIEQWGYIDEVGELIIDYSLYDVSEGRLLTIGDFQNGYGLVSKTLYCLIDKNGYIIMGNGEHILSLDSQYNAEFNIVNVYKYMDDDMVEKKYGFVNMDMEEIIPFEFEYISNIYGDLVYVKYFCEGELKNGIIVLNQYI